MLTEDGPAWARMEAALNEGCGIVVAGASPDDELVERLAGFAAVERPGVHPGARVILTQRTNASLTYDGAGGLQVPVRLPSLVDLRGELLDIVREVSAELFPGAPSPRFSPAALQCLLAWRWPGNMAELARLLADLRRAVGNGLIQTKDLPAPMRQTALSSLSRYEQSERDAIVAALAESDGNKSRAAEILGIGRTTMYRKMRALKIDDDERMIAPGP
ncbi:helix-turn-helix domain-containing protein [Arthrobacter sp. NPDC056493]|uniref:helix-turn-helix domain-containing protein n=1 Tax=Arthrobacter sp. NPDC056493 TaxID=3345839 RepID=UPI003671024C